jgi:hypothetical protein
MKTLCSILVWLFLTLPALAGKESPFACNLNAFTPAERTRHFAELSPALRNRKLAVHELPDGYEFKFPTDAKTFAMLTEWIEQERRCCPFFDIDLRVESEGRGVWMRLSGRPGTKAFIRAEAGPWLQK